MPLLFRFVHRDVPVFRSMTFNFLVVLVARQRCYSKRLGRDASTMRRDCATAFIPTRTNVCLLHSCGTSRLEELRQSGTSILDVDTFRQA